MRFPTVLFSTVFCQLAGVLAACARADDTDWQSQIRPNAAYLCAMQRPAFSMADPVGPVTSETEKT
ncbi:MAG: hypothetical protein ACYC3X_18430 [Pirellulaceae bacterium]